MKGISLIIWIILLNIFDYHICLATVRLRKLLLDVDAPLSNSTNTLTKLRFQQPHNRLLVGYENRSRKLRQLDENRNPTAPTDAIIPSREGLFENVVRRPKRQSDDNFKKANDFRRPAILKKNRKLPIESFTKTKTESVLTQFGLLKKTTKLGGKFLQAAFLDLTKTDNAINKNVSAVSRDPLNNPNANDSILYTQPSDKSFEASKSTEIIPPTKTQLHSTLSRQPFSFLPTSTDNRMSTSVTPNSNSNKTTELPVVASSIRAELTLKERSTKSFVSHDRRVSSTSKPSMTSTTDLLMRTPAQSSSLSTTHVPTHTTTTTSLTSHSKQNPTGHNTTKRKDIISMSSTSVIDTSITTTMSTDAELSTSSKPHTEMISTTQPTPIQSTGRHSSTIIASSTQTPTTTLTTTKTFTTTHHLSSATPTVPTTTSTIATSTSESSRHSSHLSTTVTASVVIDDGKNTTISNSSPSANTSDNSTLEIETTTFLLRHTPKKKVADEDSVYFWPVVLSLVIGIPAIIVFSIAMVVILKKRNIDSSTFFMNAPIGDEEV